MDWTTLAIVLIWGLAASTSELMPRWLQWLCNVIFGAIILVAAWGMAAQAQGIVTRQLTVTPNAAAYSAGQCLGGILTVPNVFVAGPTFGTIILESDITDNTGSDAAMDLLIFNQLPTGTYTDHANCTVAAADAPNLVSVIVNTTYTCVKDQPTTTGICRAAPNIAIQQGPLNTIPPTATTSLYVVPIMRGTPTYGAGKALVFSFGVRIL